MERKTDRRVKRDEVFVPKEGNSNRAFKVKSIRKGFAKVDDGEMIDGHFYYFYNPKIVFSFEFLLNKCDKVEDKPLPDIDWTKEF